MTTMPAPVRNEIAVLPQPQAQVQPSRKGDAPAQETPFEDVLQEARKSGKPGETESRQPAEKPAKANESEGSQPARKASRSKPSSKRGVEPEALVDPVDQPPATPDAESAADPITVAPVFPEELVELPVGAEAQPAEQPDPDQTATAAIAPVATVDQLVTDGEKSSDEPAQIGARAQQPKPAATPQPTPPAVPQPAEQAGEETDRPVQEAAPQAVATELPADGPVEEAVEAAPLPVKPQQAETSAVATKSRAQQPVAVAQTSLQQHNAQTSDQPLQQDQQPPAEPEQTLESTPRTFDTTQADVTSAHARPAGNAQVATPSDTASVVPVKTYVQPPQLTSDPAPPAPLPPPTPRELEFAQDNHDRLVTAIRTQLLPKGGSMQLRLDPPNLGTLEVAVRMIDGVMSVSFQTSSDETTKLLSHSLTHLKHVLESQGVSVDKLHVQQAPRSDSPDRQQADQQHQRDNLQDEASARQEQQRKEMLRRMWRKLAMGDDPLDLVA
jgi:flagellar hook-length control protein FliK